MPVANRLFSDRSLILSLYGLVLLDGRRFLSVSRRAHDSFDEHAMPIDLFSFVISPLQVPLFNDPSRDLWGLSDPGPSNPHGDPSRPLRTLALPFFHNDPHTVF